MSSSRNGEGARSRSRTVLIVHPSAELYGSDRVMLESIDAFVERGWRVVVTLPGTGPLIDQINARGVESVLCRAPVLRKSAIRPLGMVALLRDAAIGAVAGWRLIGRTRADVVYVSTVTIPLWAILAWAKRRPVLFHVHEAEGSAPLLIRRVLAAPLYLASRIMTNSEFSKSVLGHSFAAIGRRATVLYNAIPGPDEVIEPAIELASPIRLVYVGRLSHRKGVDVIFDALAQLRARGIAARLDIVGAVYPGNESYMEQLVAKVEQSDLTGQVTFNGFQHDVWPFLASADVVVVPSRVDEPFGNTAVEAVLAARPLVVSATSGLLEASDGYASIQSVVPGDAGQIADAVQRVVDSWAHYRQLALTDSRAAADRHSPKRYREGIGRPVEVLLSERKGSL